MIPFCDFLKQQQLRKKLILIYLGLSICAPLLFLQPAHAGSTSVRLEELTSTEVRDRLEHGASTMLIPIGGTEQSGPYVELGKHNFRVQYLAEKIAQKLENTLVAPVISYVPEGTINPPSAHMRFAGTISIPDVAFNATLEGAARSFKQHGFRLIIFLGDHGGYQKNLVYVARKLNQEWGRDQHVRVIALSEYYRLSTIEFDEALKKQGFTEAEIGTHAGLADTALTMAINENAVRKEVFSNHVKPTSGEGVNGDARQATVKLGQLGVKIIVDGSVAAIRAASAL